VANHNPRISYEVRMKQLLSDSAMENASVELSVTFVIDSLAGVHGPLN